ncbi:MAG: zinc ABC transporter ATP-binding protein [Euryarchaeota archaeon]|nr:zinc ABC transporter ATP-binding protein [Euryarchaeota archaeon]|tara:strand:- start:3054 stop:3857 length:804 start_codon:yes stop_codon:yes gene_type:complete
MEQIQIDVNTSSTEEKTVLDIKDLSVSRSGKLVLEDINLKIKSGEFVGIVGPNGSGKSTLMLSILGILKAQNGSVSIYGSPPMSRTLIGKIGWVSQAAANMKKDIRITVEELVKLGTINAKNMFFRSRKDQSAAVENAMRMVGIEELRSTDISKLSGGQKQRAVIARALASNADFILLDEPLVGIDRNSRNSLLKLLDNLCHDEGKTIMMVSHDLAAIRQTAHRMIFLEQKIWFDGSSEKFPDLNELANLRGIQHVHKHVNCKEEEE